MPPATVKPDGSSFNQLVPPNPPGTSSDGIDCWVWSLDQTRILCAFPIGAFRLRASDGGNPVQLTTNPGGQDLSQTSRQMARSSFSCDISPEHHQGRDLSRHSRLPSSLKIWMKRGFVSLRPSGLRQHMSSHQPSGRQMAPRSSQKRTKGGCSWRTWMAPASDQSRSRSEAASTSLSSRTGHPTETNVVLHVNQWRGGHLHG
jgi:hypothetical protein